MKKQKFNILDNDSLHEYTVKIKEVEKGTRFSLYHSKGSQWTEPTKGTLLLSMINNGDGVVFSKKLKKLDYAELTYVRLLMGVERYVDTNPMNKEPYHLVEAKTLVKL